MLEELAHGQPFSSGELATSIFNSAVEDHYITKNQNIQKWEDLSERQKQVAAMACLGYTNAEIAEKLNVSLTTVRPTSAKSCANSKCAAVINCVIFSEGGTLVVLTSTIHPFNPHICLVLPHPTPTPGSSSGLVLK